MIGGIVEIDIKLALIFKFYNYLEPIPSNVERTESIKSEQEAEAMYKYKKDKGFHYLINDLAREILSIKQSTK